VGRNIVVTGFTFLMVAALSSTALSDTLTRSACWTAKFETGSSRTLCFFGSRKVTMNNNNRTTDDKHWTQCAWTGKYSQSGGRKVRVTFEQGSGKCSNGAASPQWTVNCKFGGQRLECKGTSVVDRKTYDFDETFE
jgi:hypothetical protein